MRLPSAALFVAMSLRGRKTKNPRRWLDRDGARPCPHGQQGKKQHRDQEQPEVFLWQHGVILDADIVRQEAETLHIARLAVTAHCVIIRRAYQSWEQLVGHFIHST